MQIGIDLDNTIINYDSAFFFASKDQGILNSKEFLNKKELKKKILSLPRGVKKWQKLQGKVYGHYIDRADIMDGFKRFLNLCKIRGHKVYIISHKTKYGHYDEKKIELRKAALKFLKKKNLFDQNFFNLNLQDIYFANTRDEKINIINTLNVEYFIDDLHEVLSHKNFNKKIKKIHLTNQKYLDKNHFILAKEWTEINKIVFKNTQIKDLEFYSKLLNINHLKKISKINKGINSKVYFINNGYKNTCLKIYPLSINDKRDRCTNEFNSFKYLKKFKIKNIPKPLKLNSELQIATYSWINGSKKNKFDDNSLKNLIKFVKKLKFVSKVTNFKSFDFASESSDNISKLILMNNKRISSLKKIKISKQFKDLITKIELKNNLITYKIKKAINKGVISKVINKKNLILSPSDISLSNIISDNKIDYFVDFEYFGWDDPCKLIIDLLWHPKIKADINLLILIYRNLLKVFKNDDEINTRFYFLFNFYGIRWCLILLNVFTKTDSKIIKREMKNSDKNIYYKQLNKCSKYLQKIETNSFFNLLKIYEI